ncbi:stage II sporulation protein M [Mobilicoccus massiliensis]|uniref:stage II sporulation protein M n=1 Tax=Mobilicoccus massiliensis TaxID=1522310 RepID=UPI00058D3629|nr:stage II sporulation protein M [Mobilicoccus massiliensis]
MDVDAFTAAHRDTWARLEELCARQRLSPAETDEFLDLYQRTTTHLSLVRSSIPDPYLVPYLSWLVARARGRAHTRGHRRPVPMAVVDFLLAGFPAALYRMRWWWLSVLVVSVLYTAGAWWWFSAHPEALFAAGDSEAARRYVDHDFVDYYSHYHPVSFFLQVFTNNAWISARLIVLGVLGLPVFVLLHVNLAGLAAAGALHAVYGRVDQFFAYITPHGLLELTGVFVAAGVGLRLFWSWIEPGPRTRMAALAEEGRIAVGVALGLVALFLVAASIEAGVTPSGWPTGVRIGIGVVVEALFFAYVFVLGRRAARAGATGDVEGDAVVAELPTRA